MEEIIRHIHIEMLQAHCDAQSYIDDYMFLTERLENVFPENRNVKLEVFDDRSIEENEANFFAAELLLEDGKVLECLSEHQVYTTEENMCSEKYNQQS